MTDTVSIPRDVATDLADVLSDRRVLTDARRRELLAVLRPEVSAVSDCEELRAEVERLRELAERNWQSWEREATEHARTLTERARTSGHPDRWHTVYGAPKTGEPLSEGEARRYEAAVERGLRRRAEDQRDEARAVVERVRAALPEGGQNATEGTS